ncbi:MAG: DNA repair protein RadA [Candidatus Gygaella obscura]|nr:DNA repair protein RadA [Candidatus Gygaella obscura]
MKTKLVFTCQNCGYQSPKWLGRCPDCSNWNSFVEEDYTPIKIPKGRATNFKVADPVLLSEVDIASKQRIKLGIEELDRVLGGGIVQGSVILIGGDPGIGKSTISLQISNNLASLGKKVLYISGEESIAQTKLRADRLSVKSNTNLFIVNQTDVLVIIELIKRLKPDLVVIDSIQVLFNSDFSSSAGSITQVRESAQVLTQFAKSEDTSLVIIGHVTKEGMLAGPRVLEHMVDTVLYFEGERYSLYRIVRSVKNRFGSTNEIGVFEMTSVGLKEVNNPSKIFLSERPKGVSGSAISCIIEGTRPLMIEVQSLVSKSNVGFAGRKCQGIDYNRFSILIAILEKRMGLKLHDKDVFLNITGGIRVVDPAIDLAVAASIISSYYDKVIKDDIVLLGELGLASEVRIITQAGLRINEVGKLGFKTCVLSENNLKNKMSSKNIELKGISFLNDILKIIWKDGK